MLGHWVLDHWTAYARWFRLLDIRSSDKSSKDRFPDISAMPSLALPFRAKKKRDMEKRYLEFQRHQVVEKMTEREKELEERRWYRKLAEGAADKAKVGSHLLS